MADQRRSNRIDSDTRERLEDEKVRGLAEEDADDFDDDVDEMDEEPTEEDDDANF
jgi:hypothetical protein